MNESPGDRTDSETGTNDSLNEAKAWGIYLLDWEQQLEVLIDALQRPTE